MEERIEALRQRQENNHFVNVCGIRVESAEGDSVVCTMEVGQSCTNHLGFVHAGALYTLAENAAGAAAFHIVGRRYVTQGGNIHYLGNQKSGTLRATARVIHVGKKTCLIRTEVRGEGERLCAAGEFSFFCIDS